MEVQNSVQIGVWRNSFKRSLRGRRKKGRGRERGREKGRGREKSTKEGKENPLPTLFQTLPQLYIISYAANEHKCILSLSSCIRAYKAVTEGPFAVILHQEINFTVVKIIIFRGDCAWCILREDTVYCLFSPECLLIWVHVIVSVTGYFITYRYATEYIN